MIKAENNKLRSAIDKIKKYADKDFKNILIKMINEKKSLNEACKEAGMPHPGVVSKYAEKNAKFRKELEITYEQLPDFVQADDGELPEKKLEEDISSLKRSGITATERLRRAGVSKSMIDNRLKTAATDISSDDV